MQTAKVLVSLHFSAGSPEPSLLAHIKKGLRSRLRPKFRSLVPLDSCACMLQEWLYAYMVSSENLMNWLKCNVQIVLRLRYGHRPKKTCYCCMRTSKVKTGLNKSAVWSAPLLLTYWEVYYLNLLQANFITPASLYSWAGCLILTQSETLMTG